MPIVDISLPPIPPGPVVYHKDIREGEYLTCCKEICHSLFSGKAVEKLDWIHKDFWFFVSHYFAESSMKIDYYEDPDDPTCEEVCSVEIVFTHSFTQHKHQTEPRSELLHDLNKDDVLAKYSNNHSAQIVDLLYTKMPLIQEDVRPSVAEDYDKQIKELKAVHNIHVERLPPEHAVHGSMTHVHVRRYRWEADTERVPNKTHGNQIVSPLCVLPIIMLRDLLRITLEPKIISHYGMDYVAACRKYIQMLDIITEGDSERVNTSWLLRNKEHFIHNMNQCGTLCIVVNTATQKVILARFETIASIIMPAVATTCLKKQSRLHSSYDAMADINYMKKATESTEILELSQETYKSLARTLRRPFKITKTNTNAIGDDLTSQFLWYNTEDYYLETLKEPTQIYSVTYTLGRGTYSIHLLNLLLENLADAYVATYTIPDTLLPTEPLNMPENMHHTAPKYTIQEHILRYVYMYNNNIPCIDPPKYNPLIEFLERESTRAVLMYETASTFKKDFVAELKKQNCTYDYLGLDSEERLQEVFDLYLKDEPKPQSDESAEAKEQ